MTVVPKADTVVIIPKCPYCKAELAAPGLYNWMAASFVILGIFCTGCRCLLYTNVVPAVMPEESSLVKPS